MNVAAPVVGGLKGGHGKANLPLGAVCAVCPRCAEMPPHTQPPVSTSPFLTHVPEFDFCENAPNFAPSSIENVGRIRWYNGLTRLFVADEWRGWGHRVRAGPQGLVPSRKYVYII